MELTTPVAHVRLFITLISLGNRFQMKQGSIKRWFAVLFLLFASAEISADVVMPQLCCEELNGLASASVLKVAAFAQASDGRATISAVDNSPHQQPSSPMSAEEECFCCCAHILPPMRFDVAEFEIGSLTSGLANTALPISPPQSTYHPPRLS